MAKMVERTLPDGTKVREEHTPDPPFQAVLYQAGMPGVLALILIVTISYLFIQNPGLKESPPLLSNAVTLILGFYFGRSGK